jgi:hypothetical protein
MSVGLDEELGRRFGCGVRICWIEQRLFSRRLTYTHFSINFICTDMDEFLELAILIRSV